MASLRRFSIVLNEFLYKGNPTRFLLRPTRMRALVGLAVRVARARKLATARNKVIKTRRIKMQ